jgi:hypothetical protein
MSEYSFSPEPAKLLKITTSTTSASAAYTGAMQHFFVSSIGADHHIRANTAAGTSDMVIPNGVSIILNLKGLSALHARTVAGDGVVYATPGQMKRA